MNNIKRIVVFGCSYATGEELLYHELDYRLIAIRNANTDPRVFFNAVESNTNYQEQYSGVIKKQYELAQQTMRNALANNPTPEMLWFGVRIERQLGNKDAESSYTLELKRNYPDAPQTQSLLSGS